MTTKSVFRRQAIRAAVKIHEHLLGPARRTQVLALPQTAWDDLCRTAKLYRLAQRKGWQAAGRSLVQDVNYAALRVQREMETLRQTLAGLSARSSIVSTREVANELLALEGEFDEVGIDLKAHCVTALTAGIALEGIDLGRFRIVLTWSGIGHGQLPYNVYAREPSHPPDREDIIHPHVMDHKLCEGDGAAAIKAALNAGRLSDFFVLVRQILGTYNPESAYVSLEDWGGSISCAGCGVSMSEDDYSICERCNERICSECSWTCTACDFTVCSSCSSNCAECDDRLCNTCLTTPAGSTRNICQTCLEAQSQDQSDDKNEETRPDAPTSQPPDAVQAAAPPANAVCVGETDVFARPRRNGSRRVRRQSSTRPAARRRRTSRTPRVHTGNR